MINKLWAIFIIGGVIFTIITGNYGSLNNIIFNSASDGFNLVLDLIPVLVLWSGIMKIAEKSGLLEVIAKLFKPILSRLFPSIKNNNKALGYITSNIAANALGLGSAATPFGLKAMEEMQKDNIKKDTATEAMITFLILNTSGVTIIPTTVIGLRLMAGSINPEEIIITGLIATIISSTAGLLLDYVIRRKNK